MSATSVVPRFDGAPTPAPLRLRHALAGVCGIWLGCVIVLAVVWGGFAWMISHDSTRLAEHQETQTTLEANGFAGYVALHLVLVDRVMTNLRDTYQPTLPFHANLAPELGDNAAVLHNLSVTDESGTIIASTASGAKGVSLADRSYFRALAATPQDRLYIGETLLAGRLTGKMAMQLARPILSQKGEFRGVIVASIDPVALRSHFDRSDVFEQGGRVTIVGRDDAIVRVRFARDSITSGDAFPYSPSWTAMSEQVSGYEQGPSAVDGVERRAAFRQVGTYPLTVRVSIPMEKAWSLDNKRLNLALVMAMAFSVALVLLARARARLEVEQEANVRRLAASHQKELDANQMKSRFLASVSHELRTPLNSILGFSELIRDEVSGPDTSKFAGLIHNSGKHLHTLVNTLLDLAKIEAGRMEVDAENVDLGELLMTMTDTHRVSIKGKALSLSLKFSPPGPITVNTDRTKLVTVLNNVLHNAIKFTEYGQIDVTCSSRPDGVLIRVTDSGRGIAEKDIARVFERFNTVGIEPEQQKGSGLGLALSRSLMELLGGTITLESQLGEGTRVDIFLPKGERK